MIGKSLNTETSTRENINQFLVQFVELDQQTQQQKKPFASFIFNKFFLFLSVIFFILK